MQNFNPTGHLGLSALLAVLPLATLLVLLAGLKVKAHWAGMAALAVSLIVAVAGYSMPLGQALDAGVYGAALSVLAILWITFNAIWIYEMTVQSGHFAVLRRAFARISDDQRIQAIVIAFCFGALIEALAGGGSPVAICAVMLIAVGFNPLKAAALALIADTAPVAFGGMGNPITILGTVTGLPADQFGAMVGRQTPLLALIVPFVLVFVADGRRGVRQTRPAALAAGASFAAAQYVLSNFGPYKLTDIFAAVVSAAVVVGLGKVWSPTEPLVFARPASVPLMAGGSVDASAAEIRTAGLPGGDSARSVAAAFAPYAIIVALFSLAQVTAIKNVLLKGTYKFTWPGIHLVNPKGKPVLTAYVLNWASATGTLLFAAGVLTMLVLRISAGQGLRAYGVTLKRFGWAIVTILCVFALAYVMQLSGQTVTLGLFLAGAGGFFAFLSPVVGWFGVTITGTDAGANALFAGVQTTAAAKLHVSPILLGAANSSGGVMAKMISPQNLAIGMAAVGQVGEEGTLLRRVLGWSALLLLVLCVLVYLQSTSVLGWMVAGG